MSEQNQQNNNTGAQQEQPTNKVSFSSVRGGTNSKGSPTVALHVGGKHLDNLIELLIACRQEAGSVGAKLMVQIIPGKEYDSGYAYITPKLPRDPNQAQGQGNRSNYGNNRQSNNGGGFNRAPTQNQTAAVQGQASAKSFFNNKRIG